MRRSTRIEWPLILALLASAIAGAAAASLLIDSPASRAIAADPPAVRAAKALDGGPPAPGWTTPATVQEVYDGDTIVVEVRREFRVRLLNLWSPEIRTKDAAEKRAGLAARDHLRGLLPVGSDVVLSVPTHGADVAEAWTMGRLLGHVWRPGDRVTLSRQMIDAGFGTLEKGGK